MKPVIAIIGRPNVGKSTLFNRLTRSREALVADFAGLTRDRQYGEGRLGSRPYIVIDTGGIGQEDHAVDELMVEQVEAAMAEADVIFFMVDGRAGPLGFEYELAGHLRSRNKPLYLLVNKTDGMDADVACSEFYQLGLTEPLAIAASHGRGVHALIEKVLAELPEPVTDDVEPENPGIKLAIVGRPNVGKSTLVNRLLGEARVVVYDLPGTTRDSIFIPWEREGQRYTLIDTAGVRRRGRVQQTVEKFSVIKTLQAIEVSDVVVAVFDAREGITDQDLHLLGFILDAGKALVITLNKWDGLSPDQRERVKADINRRLVFIKYVSVFFISALHGTGVGNIFAAVTSAYRSATRDVRTAELNRILARAVTAHQPPLRRGRRIKLRYAHLGGKQPPTIVIHGNQLDALPKHYQRYLMNEFRSALNLVGTPLRLSLQTSENPYQHLRNRLTPRQQQKRKRLMKHVKKRK